MPGGPHSWMARISTSRWLDGRASIRQQPGPRAMAETSLWRCAFSTKAVPGATPLKPSGANRSGGSSRSRKRSRAKRRKPRPSSAASRSKQPKSAPPRPIGSPNGLYWDGIGIGVDRAEAVRLFKRGADQGDPFSRQRLAELYETGDRLPQDLERALFHYAIETRLFEAAGDAPDAAIARARRGSLARTPAGDSRPNSPHGRRLAPRGTVTSAEPRGLPPLRPRRRCARRRSHCARSWARPWKGLSRWSAPFARPAAGSRPFAGHAGRGLAPGRFV